MYLNTLLQPHLILQLFFVAFELKLIFFACISHEQNDSFHIPGQTLHSFAVTSVTRCVCVLFFNSTSCEGLLIIK